MSYLHVDANFEFKLTINETEILLVEEFRDIVRTKKYGWNFLYYLFLFCSRVPFGHLPENMKDERISQIVKKWPHRKNSPTNVDKFYQDRLFSVAAKVYPTIFPDPEWDFYLMLCKQQSELTSKLSGLDMTDMNSSVTMPILVNNLTAVRKMKKEAEVELQQHIKQGGNKNIMGAGAIKV